MQDIKYIKSNKYLVKLTIPVFFETLLQLLVINIDQFMINDYSNVAYDAIGHTNNIISLCLITFNIVATASTIIISQYIGAKNKKEIEQLYSLALIVNLVFGVIVSLFLLIFRYQIFEWLNWPDIYLNDSITYLTIFAATVIIDSIFVTYIAFFKSHHLMKQCLYISILINVLNVIGNALLIYVFNLGVAGVAYASAFSRLVGTIILIILYKKKIGVKISIKKIIPFPFKQFKKILKIGIPSAGENISYDLAMIVIIWIVNEVAKNAGNIVVTAKVTINLLSFISWVFAAAISMTTQVIVGYLMGAKDIKGTDERFKSSRKMAMFFSFIGSMILLILCRPICGIFIDDSATLDICQKIMIVEVFLEQGRAVNMTAVRSLQACGDTKFPIILGIISEWTIAVGLGIVFTFVFNFGIIAIWIAMAADEILRAIMFTIRWKRGKWRSMVLTD